MILKEFNQVDQHVEESELATIALNSFRVTFRAKGLVRSYTLQGAREFDQAVVFPWFKAVPAELGSAEAWTNQESSTVIGLYFVLPKDHESAKKYIFSTKFESLFRHEFQHYLDKRTARFRKQRKQPDSYGEYVNSDEEYEAFFKQQAEPLLKILRAARAGQDISQYPKIEPDFKRFMRAQHIDLTDKNVPLKDFDEHTRSRYIHDLAAIHKAVVTIEGAAGRFNPTMMKRIMLWLRKKISVGF